MRKKWTLRNRHHGGEILCEKKPVMTYDWHPEGWSPDLWELIPPTPEPWPDDREIWQELWAERDKLTPSMAWNVKHWHVTCMFTFCLLDDGRGRIEKYMSDYGYGFTEARKRAWADWHIDNGVTF